MRLLSVLTLITLLGAARAPHALAESGARLSGDLDGDGTVCAADAAAVLRAAGGSIRLDTQTTVQADTTGDQTVGGADALAILLLTVGKLKSFADLVLSGGASLLGERYLDQFSYLGVVRAKNGYYSRQLSVRISTFTYEGAVCYLADIYLQRIESLRTAFGGGAYEGGRDTMQNLAAESGAILTINGDEYARLSLGPLVRNGVWYRQSVDASVDVCALYGSGEMETFRRGKVKLETLLARDVYQAWTGGTALLDENGAPFSQYAGAETLLTPCARAAIGYYEPGHYCMFVSDGTQNPASAGLTLPQLATFFEQLGCKSAFSLCGGMNALLCFGTDAYSTPYKEARALSDVIYLCEPDAEANG